MHFACISSVGKCKCKWSFGNPGHVQMELWQSRSCWGRRHTRLCPRLHYRLLTLCPAPTDPTYPCDYLRQQPVARQTLLRGGAHIRGQRAGATPPVCRHHLLAVAAPSTAWPGARIITAAPRRNQQHSGSHAEGRVAQAGTRGQPYQQAHVRNHTATCAQAYVRNLHGQHGTRPRSLQLKRRTPRRHVPHAHYPMVVCRRQKPWCACPSRYISAYP